MTTFFDLIVMLFWPVVSAAAAWAIAVYALAQKDEISEVVEALTGPQESIDALTKAAGFQYQYDPKTGQFAHATAIMILTPEGKIAQYYYGVEYAPKDLRLGLIQASQNKIGTLADQVLLYCYHYDPTTGKYGAIISRVLKLAGIATLLGLGILMTVLIRLGSGPRGHEAR